MPSNVFTTLELGGVVIPIHSSLELRQTYGILGGFNTLRMLDGAAVKQTNWTKLSTNLSGSGNIPVGLDTLDYSQQLEMKCAAKRGVTSDSNVFAIPAERRSDAPFQPEGFGYVDEEGKNRGVWVETAITDLTGDIATLDPVDNAIQYRVTYYPEILVFCEEPEQDVDVHGEALSWTLNAEQV